MVRDSRCQESFRPLSGSYISQLFVDSFQDQVNIVSVPYRGATFLNTMFSGGRIPGQRKVSVPYRGATFLNEEWKIKEIFSCCFRPLSGSYISQLFAEKGHMKI